MSRGGLLRCGYAVSAIISVGLILQNRVLESQIAFLNKGVEESFSPPRAPDDSLNPSRIAWNTDYNRSLVSTISEVIYELPPLDNNALPFASNFYEILQDVSADCLPTSKTCVACLQDKVEGADCVSCASVCPCYCKALCNTPLEPKFVSKSLIVKPPEHSTTPPQRLIPRKIHQAYSERITKQKYPNYSRMVASFRTSGWDYNFYTDAEIKRFLLKHFPDEVYEAYKALRPGAFRADLFRYCVLLIHGGVYADIDILLQSNLDVVVEADVGFMAPLDQPGVNTGDRMCLWNGFLAAAPGHPFLAKAIETVVNQVRGRFTGVDIANSFCPQPELSLLHAHDVLFLTGPCLLGGSVNKFLGLHGQHPFEIGEIETLDLQSAPIPGRAIVLEQRKKDMGFHTIMDPARNLIIAGTDLYDADDRVELNAKYEHYSKTRKNNPVYGVTSVYVDNQMVDEEIRIEVDNTKVMKQWTTTSGNKNKGDFASMSFEFPSVEERVKYYMGSWYKAQKFNATKLCSEVCFFQRGLPPIDVPYIFNALNINDHPLEPYTRDIKEYLLRAVPDSDIVLAIGDDASPGLTWPVITKSRPMNGSGKKSILALLHENRHFSEKDFDMAKENTISWYDKHEVLFWRGSTTGGSYRIDIVKKYINATQDGIDVAFNALVERHINNPEAQGLIGRTIKPEDMLKYKYLLAPEGNDVATGLKWMMYSNSVVFMAPPRFESWAMEGLLIPYYHYIPVAPDYSDLKEKLEWAKSNDALCRRIALQATRYIENLYTSVKAEKETEQVHNEMMKRYHMLYGDVISATCQKNHTPAV
ncbi:MAG: hypothetical protein SGILL_005630 [Bacillariaceae sp.]